MAHTLRDTAASFRGDYLLKLTTSALPAPEPSPSTPYYLTCQDLDQLRPSVRILAAALIRTVEITAILHAVNRGSTVSLIHGNLASQNCYAVSTYPELTVELPSEPSVAHLFAFVLNNLALLLHPERALGTWVNAKGIHVLDVVTYVGNRELALELGAKFSQYSIFDLAAGREILAPPRISIDDHITTNEVKS
jgi:hypothetical protein